jgi:hypothetical protein
MKAPAVAVLLTLFALPSAARASDGETALSVYAGYAGMSFTDGDDDIQPNGGAIGFDYERGFSEILSWRLSAGGGVYTSEPGMAYSTHATAGITYLFDVLKWVPYANLGVGGIVLTGEGFDTKVHPLIELGFGIDKLHSRTFSYGIQVRVESFITNTAYFSGGVRATWRWGFF